MDDQGKTNQELQEEIDRQKALRYYQQQEYERRKKRRSPISVARDFWKNTKRIARVGRFVFSAASNPAVAWSIFGVIIFIIFYAMFFSPQFSITDLASETPFTPDEPPEVPVIPGIEITVVSYGDDGEEDNEVANGENINYRITVVYDEDIVKAEIGDDLDLIIIGHDIPPGTEFVSSSPSSPTCNYRAETGNAGETGEDTTAHNARIECVFGLLADTGSGNTFTFTTTVNPTVTDTYITNSVYIGIVDQEGGVLRLGASIDRCQEDPQDLVCSFSKDRLYSLLKNLDPKNADIWFYKIIPCESGYDPFLRTSYSNTFDKLGLFQLLTPRSDSQIPSWQNQVKFAVNYNYNELGGSFSYWSCSN